MLLHHIALTAINIDATIAWYREVFDVVIERVVNREDLSVSVYFLSDPGMKIRFEIFSFKDAAPLPSYRMTVDSDIRVCGVKHFAMEVEDINSAITRALVAGTQLVEGPHLSYDGNNLYAFVSDPSGNMIEFLEFIVK